MDLAAYNRFCRALPHTTHVVQWGGAHVWKIGGKVFAIAGWSDDDQLAVTFKCTPAQFDLLEQLRGCRPAPYLASRGLTWIQRTDAGDLSDAGLRACLRESYALALATLPRKVQRALVDDAPQAGPAPTASRQPRHRRRDRAR